MRLTLMATTTIWIGKRDDSNYYLRWFHWLMWAGIARLPQSPCGLEEKVHCDREQKQPIIDGTMATVNGDSRAINCRSLVIACHLNFSNFVIANRTTRTKLIFSQFFFSSSTSLEDDFSSDPKQTLLPSKYVCVCSMFMHRTVRTHVTTPRRDHQPFSDSAARNQMQRNRHWCVLSCHASYRSIPSRARVKLDKRRHIMVLTKT